MTMTGAAKTILLVEENSARASMIARLLRQADYRVDGPYRNVSDGIAALAAHFPDGAIIDADRVRAGEDLLAGDLDRYGIPYIICSSDPASRSAIGRHPAAMLIDHRDIPRQLLKILSDTLH
ncbi:hypothetical protein WG908_05615 [Sphingobium sp. AN641]|uniref:hypothetical protein n=1 Tax=Sphingobium sp. AN641 TaxID=3133443 RepID=UPI0030BCE61C